MPVSKRHRLKALVLIVAYNAAKTIIGVLQRIPRTLSEAYELSVLVIDDCSQDDTVEVTREYLSGGFWCSTVLLRNPGNLGYGGNQKLGYRYAIDNGFDVVALLHGDGQYAPECLPALLRPFADDHDTGAVFGSRMLNKRQALKGGMPLYKFLGNQVLTRFQNRLLGSHLSEFHTGYRVYSVAVLGEIPFELNTDDFHFDTEIIVQLFFLGARVVELPIPTHYGDEVCHVDGLQYAWNVSKASIKARLIRLGIFYDPKFCPKSQIGANYVSKFTFFSTHSAAFLRIPLNSAVLDLGCADGYLSEKLHREKNCEVSSVDRESNRTVPGCRYISCDLNYSLPDIQWQGLDVIILLDIIEHLTSPEEFLNRLRVKLSGNSKVQIIISSGNVCFFVTRLMMLLGQFNYGRRGILDITHTRLFTVKSLRRVLRYATYEILDQCYVPAPYPLALGLNAMSKFLVTGNRILARMLPGLFAYQALYVVRPKPSLDWLLQRTVSTTPKESP
jgi:glycosyltransferase involved in cell wall biosynthesis